MASRGRGGQWRYAKSESTGSSSEDLPSATLSWYQIGRHSNITGFCTTGELFCFLGSSGRRHEHSQLLKVVAGQQEASTLVCDASDLAEGVLPEQRNKIMGRSRSNTLTGGQNQYVLKRETSGDRLAAAVAQYDSIENRDNNSTTSSSHGDKQNQHQPGGIFVDGVPLSHKANPSRKRLSYLEPNDTNKLYSDLTVLETLVFSSQMRQEAKMRGVKKESNVQPAPPAELNVLRLLTDMGFKDWAETKTGELDKWQRRMVLFATEAVAGKDVLLFDYPTTDLDVPSALALVTALQRAAKGGRLVALTMTSLTFREYAMLDKIQLLSSNGSIYFGAVSGAMNYFASLNRTPSPGASISDFLLDMVDDDLWPGGYSDAHLTFLESEAQKSAENDFHELMVDNTPEKSGSMAVNGALCSLSARDQSYQQVVNVGSPAPSRHSQSRGPSLSSSGHGYSPLTGTASSPGTTDLESMYDNVMNAEWLPSAALDGGSSDTCTGMCLSSALALQFVLCLWRAFLVRWRGLETIVSSWVTHCCLVTVALLLAFSTASGDHQKTYFLTAFPFVISLLLNLWNDKMLLYRHIFVFERDRDYFHQPWMSVIATLLADIVYYHTVPPLLTSCILYYPLGLRRSWVAFGVFTSTILLICVVAACFSRALFFLLDAASARAVLPKPKKTDRDADYIQAARAASFTATILSVFLLFTGTMLNLDDIGSLGRMVQYSSFFFWGTNVLYWNEWESEEIAKGHLAHSMPHIDLNVGLGVLCAQLMFYLLVVALASFWVGRAHSQ